MIFLKNIFDKIIFKYINYKKNLIKFGIDSTYFSIHNGHFYIINFIYFLISKKFKIIIIIGDYTANLKKKIDKKNLIINSICLKSQIYNLLGNIFIFFNSIWLKKINFLKIIKIFKLINITKFLNKTLKKNLLSFIKINDFLYPIIQSIDSIILKCNYEIGGKDQLFNTILGRFLQNFFFIKKQNILLLKLLEINGKKISKSDFNIFFIEFKILFHLKFFTKNKKKKNIIFNNFFLKKKNKKYIYFNKNNYLSFYLKKIFLLNKNKIYNFIYKKKIYFNNIFVAKNFFCKKNIFFLNINKNKIFLKIYENKLYL